ncbi:MAG: hypothetical protein JKY48_17880 [Flavobacteriales bacterium]|nr:hypothetical protein [Flavobacteriales bacterium]
MRIILVTFFAILSLSSCSLGEDEKKEVLARVGDEYLYREDVISLINSENEEDSIAKLRSFVDNWVKEQLLLQKALDNLPEKQANFEEQLESYKNSLLIYAFENQLVKQKLDTTTSDQELKEYFLQHKENFKLKEGIVKGVFISRIASAPQKDSLEYWLFKDNAYYKEELIEYCSQFASACQLDTNTWIPLTKIKELTNISADKNLNLTRGKNILEDSLKIMLIQVFDLKSKGDIAAFSWVRNELRGIILNKRKIELISRVKQEIFEAATLKEEYEIYE